MPHTHPTTDRITVISGTLHQGMGGTFDQSDSETVPAGGFVYQAANVPHYVWFDQETVLQFSGTGPFGLTYVNPDDDPRNKR
jgi:quercetin dioxygenase-like cupin family protein